MADELKVLLDARRQYEFWRLVFFIQQGIADLASTADPSLVAAVASTMGELRGWVAANPDFVTSEMAADLDVLEASLQRVQDAALRVASTPEYQAAVQKAIDDQRAANEQAKADREAAIAAASVEVFNVVAAESSVLKVAPPDSKIRIAPAGGALE